tara:strand:+ start:89 stop:436 length:348 start_codon:yes stop_codon:yes gene_type:complete
MKNKLTTKSQNTLKRLRLKSNNLKGSRFPSLKSIHNLLTELKIEHTFGETYCEKHTKPSGYQYSTGGGSKTYSGFTLRITDKRCEDYINMDSTDSYYSWNTYGYARDLCKLIYNN